MENYSAKEVFIPLSIILAVICIAIFAFSLGLNQGQKKNTNFLYCPYCGEILVQ